MSRGDRFDRGDFEVRYARQAPNPTEAGTVQSARAEAPPSAIATSQKPSPGLIWPIARAAILRVGQSVLTDRNGKGRPHKGIDILAPAGTSVVAAQGGRVLRVVDGRGAAKESTRRAGLFIDVKGLDARIYRYLHMGESRVAAGQKLDQGEELGRVADAHTSGLGKARPHLHFEIRLGDVDRQQQDYGTSIDPLRFLPPFRV